MPDWSALRRRAQETHLQLRALLPEETPVLPSADALLDAAEQLTEVSRLSVPPGDPLLGGANALLDRAIPAIWYAEDAHTSRPRLRFSLAHEFAHYWLHPDLLTDACHEADTPEPFVPNASPAVLQVAEGYNPHERREMEANLFAAELLLPAPSLWQAYVVEGWSVADIARRTGLSETYVLSQLSHAILGVGRWVLGVQVFRYSGVQPSTKNTKQHEEAHETHAKPKPPPAPLLRKEGERVMLDSPPSLVRNERQGKGAGGLGKPTAYCLLPTASPNALLLDPSQQQAAEIARGPVLVDAGPGTGKTRTLVARAAYLLGECRVAPENILALTFSNKAAEEMRTRLRTTVGEAGERVWIGTFHAFGYELIRKEGQRLGLPLHPRLIDLADAVTLLERHLDQLTLEEFEYLSQPALPFPDILRCISRAKDELRTPADYHALARTQLETAQDEREVQAALKSVEIARFYGVYQTLLQRYGLLDFGDLLFHAVTLLTEYPDVRERWQVQYPHLLADEYQDINRASAILLQALAGTGRGFWAVGDLRQAIYRFRGASPANVQQFEQDFPGGQRLRLDRNYRSIAPIVTLFSQVAGRMASEREVQWQALRAGEELPGITFATASDEEAQADGLAQEIRRQEAEGVPRNDQAILCRTNAQCEDMARRLEARGIPVQHLGNLFDRPEVRDLLALLALLSDPAGTTLERVAQFPEYAVPREEVRAFLQQTGIPVFRYSGVQVSGSSGIQEDASTPNAQSPTPNTHNVRAVNDPSGRRSANRPADGNALQDSPPSLVRNERQGKGVGGLGEPEHLNTRTPEHPNAHPGLALLMSHLQPLMHLTDPWTILTRYLFVHSGYLRPLLADESIANRQRRMAIRQLLTFVQSTTQRLMLTEGEVNSAVFLNHLRHLMACGEERSVRLTSEADDLDAVRLMTVHQSKGLEFPVVYLPNLIEGQFPPRGGSRMASPPPGLAGEKESGAEGEESGEECLFFVALSRARDHLVMMRPEKWRGRVAKPSPLLEGFADYLEQQGVPLMGWQRDTSPTVVESAEVALSAERPTYSVSALEQYQNCPRQFYYQRVARVPVSRSPSPYQAFHESLQRTLEWLQAERAKGEVPSLADALTHLETLWAEQEEALDNAQGRVLREHAVRMLEHAHDHLEAAPKIVPDVTLTAELEHGDVQMRCDQVEHLPDGTLRVARHVRRRARKDDHTEPRLALLRHAALQQDPARPVQVTLLNLREGETKEVPASPRYEPARVAKYDAALQGIRAGQFPAQPDARTCASCPFLFLCPT